MYSQQPYNNAQQPALSGHLHLQEQDIANLVLSELKRTAREYTTGALEAANPAIRQTFVSLTQKTLQDQAELFNVLSQQNAYGSIKLASSQEAQQELQQQARKADQLQTLVQQALQNAYAGTNAYAQAQQPQIYPQSQTFGQNQAYAPSYAAGSAGFGNPSISSSVTPSYSAASSTYTASPGLQGAATGSFGTSSAFNYGAAGAQDDYAFKSSVSGTDALDYYTAKASQDYSGGKYNAVQDSYGVKSSQDTSYASSTAARQPSSYSFGGASSIGEQASVGSLSSNVGISGKNAQSAGTSSVGKYI